MGTSADNPTDALYVRAPSFHKAFHEVYRRENSIWYVLHTCCRTLVKREIKLVIWYGWVQVGSPRIEGWYGQLYPDFVGEGRSDQETIMGAICAVKKASFDGVDCVGGDAEATGTVKQTRCFANHLLSSL